MNHKLPGSLVAMVLRKLFALSIFAVSYSTVLAEDASLLDSASPDQAPLAGTDPIPLADNLSAFGDEIGDENPLVLAPNNWGLGVEFGASYLYDSNTLLLPEGEGSSFSVFDLKLSYVFGNENIRGAYIGASYQGYAFAYESSESRAGREPYEHDVKILAGIIGAKTRLRMSLGYQDNNGNSIDYQLANREVGQVASQDYEFKLDLLRDFPHGSIDTGFEFSDRDFDLLGLNDGTRYMIDTAWLHQPGFAPKTNMGVGFNAGHDDFDRNLSQNYYSPSVRFRHRFTAKTTFYGTLGYEFRDVQGERGVDTGSSVYRYGVVWAATERCNFDLNGYRSVQPSYVSFGESYDATGVRLQMNLSLPWDLFLSASTAYEDAKYFASVRDEGGKTDRSDDFIQFAVELNHEMQLIQQLDGKVGLFFNYNDNDSSEPAFSYDRHVTGIRLSFDF